MTGNLSSTGMLERTPHWIITLFTEKDIMFNSLDEDILLG